MALSKVILVRHAASTGPSSEAPLSEEGYQQSLRLAENLAPIGIDAVFSSPYKRAVETIEPFAENHNFDIQILLDLKERKLSAQPTDDWLEHIRKSFSDHDHHLEGGESLVDTRKRALKAIKSISEQDCKLPVAVSHGNWIASVLTYIDSSFGFEDWRSLGNPDVI
ncbi:MAG: histidine phosphatase family protein [Pseudomonadota bacterium]